MSVQPEPAVIVRYFKCAARAKELGYDIILAPNSKDQTRFHLFKQKATGDGKPGKGHRLFKTLGEVSAYLLAVNDLKKETEE